mmetsp:Transcript_10080/g.16734  ORF Transcript_10080/g.16734 Transcript_10080/m.16734 type:complete len:383 (-) Transcript_10080:116-1264(-)|eukprot:CAMPEP_0119004834 /NCGR_PEP_ID=MMETSP1176-20130426/1380_1 /TAXON_ID=265551 /ORGANISM="Synedropsis recta cf, Strain CCMP1620" /LENGTH=382 /DNA_ID=CAMNT_0006956587 /DNA_START=66 /DNA_END=1214 /DNA_ORIENTATION=-
MAKPASTPVRNNYAAPHTPITSVKRPRSSLDRSSSAIKNTPMKSPAPASSVGITSSMSPMHPARPVETADGETTSWVGRKVDALFSPVVSLFLSGSKDEEEEAAAVTDEDATMDDTSTPKSGDVEEEAPSNTGSGSMDASIDIKQCSEEEVATLQEDPSSEVEDEDDEDEFNPYLFIKSLPRYEAVQHLRPSVALPPKDSKDPPITLVLDLDETLVHCTVEATEDSDLTFPVFFHNMEYQVHVKLRPHVFEFLEKVCEKFEVVVFTASQKVYADELLNRIDPTGKFIKYRMFRESCLAVEGNFLKDLHVVGRDMRKMVLVDNSPHAFGYQMDNGIPIESWFDDPHDTELLKLERFLSTLHPCKDVRTAVRAEFETFRKVQDS